MRSQQAVDQDADLARRCVAGDQQAWHTLYQCYHSRLVTTVALLFGPAKRDLSQAEEVIGEVWLSLWQNNRRRLRAYNANQASLSVFLAARARQQACYFLRRQAGLVQVQVLWPMSSPAAPDCPLLPQGLWWQEFCESLPAPELQFLCDCLTPPLPSAPPPAALSAYQRKLKQRVLAKLRAFLGLDAV